MTDEELKQTIDKLEKHVEGTPKAVDIELVTRSLKKIERRLRGASPDFLVHLIITAVGLGLVFWAASLLTPKGEAVTGVAVLLVGAALLFLGASLTVHRALTDAKADAYGAPTLLLLVGTIVLAQAVYSMKPSVAGTKTPAAGSDSAKSDSPPATSGAHKDNSSAVAPGGAGGSPPSTSDAAAKPPDPPPPPAAHAAFPAPDDSKTKSSDTGKQ